MNAAVHLWVGLCGVAMLGCSSHRDVLGGSMTGSAGATQGAKNGTPDAGPDLNLNLSEAGAVVSTVGCSADLRSVIDENQAVVRDCPSDQGCLSGECVPACAAAAATKGSIGCDFWAPPPPPQGDCYAVIVANTWGRPAQLSVSLNGQALDATQFARIPRGTFPNVTYDPLPHASLLPEEVAILFLSDMAGAEVATLSPNLLDLVGSCPVTPAHEASVDSWQASRSSGKTAAFHVTSDTPLTAYDIDPFGGASSYYPSSSLLFPSTAWGTNYVVAAPVTTDSQVTTTSSGDTPVVRVFGPWMQVIAQSDDTRVTLLSAHDLLAGQGVPALTTGQATEVTLHAGEVLQWQGPRPGVLDVSGKLFNPGGTIVQSSKALAVFSGTLGSNVSTALSPGTGASDAMHQQLPPINALSNAYVGAGFISRIASGAPEIIPHQLSGVVDGTRLSYDPAPPDGAPTTLNAGQVVTVLGTQLFSVRSQDEQHPFVFAEYMAGAPDPAQGTEGHALGDPDWVVLVSPVQYLTRYVFFTDPTYGWTNLTVTRVRAAAGFSDVVLDCQQAPIDKWQPVGTAGDYEVAYVDLVRNGRVVDTCGGGRHEIRSSKPFGLTVWGTDDYASYGYPAGGNLAAVNTVVVPPVVR